MRKTMCVFVLACMLLGLTACGTAQKNKQKEIKAAVFYYSFSDAFLSEVRTELDDSLTGKQISFENYDAGNKQEVQNDQIRDAVANGANVLLVNIVTSGSPAASQNILNIADGVPVIFFNRSIDVPSAKSEILIGHENVGFVGTETGLAGHIQGQMIGQYLAANFENLDRNQDGTISYAMLKGADNSPECTFRCRYSVDVANTILEVSGKPSLTYFDPTLAAGYQADPNGLWSYDAALDIMISNLKKYNPSNNSMIELVICNNDHMASGAVAALQSIGFNDGDSEKTIPVFGIDATNVARELIAAGLMEGTVVQDTNGMATALAGIVSAVAEGKTVTEGITHMAEDELFTIAEGYSNKLYITYSPYTK